MCDETILLMVGARSLYTRRREGLQLFFHSLPHKTLQSAFRTGVLLKIRVSGDQSCWSNQLESHLSLAHGTGREKLPLEDSSVVIAPVLGVNYRVHARFRDLITRFEKPLRL